MRGQRGGGARQMRIRTADDMRKLLYIKGVPSRRRILRTARRWIPLNGRPRFGPMIRTCRCRTGRGAASRRPGLKPLMPILGGLLPFESEWSPALRPSFEKALSAAVGEGRLDLGFVASRGHFSSIRRRPPT